MTGSVRWCAHRDNTDVCSVGAFVVKPHACDAPRCGFGGAQRDRANKSNRAVKAHL
jgi:hypothetical protein